MKKAKDKNMDWVKFMPIALYAICLTLSVATGYSPFALVHGRNMPPPVDLLHAGWLEKQCENSSVREWMSCDCENSSVREWMSCDCENSSVREWMSCDCENSSVREWMSCDCENSSVSKWIYLCESIELLREKSVWNLDRNSKKRKRLYDRCSKERKFGIGESVLWRAIGMPGKLQDSWLGPYAIEEILSPVSYGIALDSKRKKVVHVNSLKKFIDRDLKVLR